MKSSGVWISRASTYTWLQPPAKSTCRPSSSSTRPRPSRSTCTPTCPCALDGGPTLAMTGRRAQTPTCPRGLEGLGRRLGRLPSVTTLEMHQTRCCPRDLGEMSHTGAFSGLWPANSCWTLICYGRHVWIYKQNVTVVCRWTFINFMYWCTYLFGRVFVRITDCVLLSHRAKWFDIPNSSEEQEMAEEEVQEEDKRVEIWENVFQVCRNDFY